MTKRKLVGLTAAAALLLVAGIAVLIWCVITSCKHRADHIELVYPASLTLTTKAPFKVSATARDRQGAKLDCPVTRTIQSDAVIGLGTPSDFRCNQRGKATLTFSLEARPEIQKTLEIACRLVDGIVAPEQLLLRVKEPPRELEFQTFSGPEEVFDAAIGIESANPAVVKVQGKHLVPVSVGRTVVRVSAGDVSTNTKILVGERVTGGDFALSDGASTTYDVPPGSYHIEIRAEGGWKSRTELTWEGISCDSHSVFGPDVFKCFAGNDALLRVTNPTFLPHPIPPEWVPGPVVRGYVSITRIP